MDSGEVHAAGELSGLSVLDWGSACFGESPIGQSKSAESAIGVTMALMRGWTKQLPSEYAADQTKRNETGRMRETKWDGRGQDGRGTGTRRRTEKRKQDYRKRTLPIWNACDVGPME